MKNCILGLTNTRKLTLLATMALMLSVTALSASPAMAAPKGEYAVFADCPLSHAELVGCIAARTEKGKIIIGKRTVPLEHTITLQGGIEEETPCEFPFAGKGECRSPFVGAADGNTLSKTAQNVPGGLTNLINCKAIKNELLRHTCEFFFEHGITAVTATTELALPASSIGLSQPALAEPILSEAFGIPALSLPVKVKLDNPLFGKECYIGSAAEPITLNLITGKTNPPAPNKPISGQVGEISSRAEGGILVISNNSLVDNSFKAPGTNGCGFFGLLDPLLNAALGVPSEAGHNTAILEGTLEQTNAALAKEHE